MMLPERINQEGILYFITSNWTRAPTYANVRRDMPVTGVEERSGGESGEPCASPPEAGTPRARAKELERF